MNIHPVANLFPLMTAEEFADLKSDIAANGLREPIWTYQDAIIDGRNRYRACTELGIAPVFRVWGGEGSLVAFVVSLNLHRRHLNSGQRATLAADIEPMLAEEAKRRQREHGNTAPGRKKSESLGEIVPQVIDDAESKRAPKATEEAAKIAGTNGRYVQNAKTLKQKAPELFEAVKAGEVSLPQATAEVRRQEKRAALEAKAAAMERLSQYNWDQWQLIEGDCVNHLIGVERESARLVFADPPYNIGIDYGEGEDADRLSDTDYLSWVASWVDACHRALMPDGSLWVLIGQEYAAEYAVILKRQFTIRSWIIWYESFGVNCSDKFNRTSRHLFYCVKDAKRFVFHADAVTRPSDRQEKYGDKRAASGGKLWDDVWGINPPIPRLTGTCAERIPDFPTQLPLALLTPIILCASHPGDLVIDPFNGSGTTGVAALTHGRRYLGVEKSPVFAELARKRLLAAERK